MSSTLPGTALQSSRITSDRQQSVPIINDSSSDHFIILLFNTTTSVRPLNGTSQGHYFGPAQPLPSSSNRSSILKQPFHFSICFKSAKSCSYFNAHWFFFFSADWLLTAAAIFLLPMPLSIIAQVNVLPSAHNWISRASDTFLCINPCQIAFSAKGCNQHWRNIHSIDINQSWM